MWILLLVNSYVMFTFQCGDSGVGIVSKLRDERMGFHLRQGLMYLCPRQYSERIWWPRPHNHWAAGFRTPTWRGFGLMLGTNTHSTLSSKEHGAMSPLPHNFSWHIARLSIRRTFINFPLITDNSCTLRIFVFLLVLPLNSRFLLQFSRYETSIWKM